MDLDKTIEKINKDREKTEAAWVFCLWESPDLFEDYKGVNVGNDKTLRSEDAVWYFNLGKSLYKEGFKEFDAVTLETFLSNKPALRKTYEKYGGYTTVKELRSLVNPDNVDGYFDQITKMNSLTGIAKKYDEIFNDVDRFKTATNEDVYNTFDTLNNSISVASFEKVEDLTASDDFVEGLRNGDNMGFSYGKYAPLLNYITLGASPGVYMIAGHSGTGKSSFVMGNMLMGLHAAGVGVAVISNEMDSNTYKLLLLEHVLTQELGYYNLPRKTLRKGTWNEEQEEMIEKAKKITEEKYGDIKFIRLYGNSISKVTKYLRKLKSSGVSVVLFDTFKADDSSNLGEMWQSLLMDSRKLDTQCQKLGICCITTYQLALHTLNQRYLDASCLSNAKQIKEVYNDMIYMRPVWDDEFPGEKYDIKPFRRLKDNPKVKENIIMDPDKKYLLFFVDKTRSDEDKQVLLYEWKAHLNIWKELGYANVVNNHGGGY